MSIERTAHCVTILEDTSGLMSPMIRIELVTEPSMIGEGHTPRERARSH